MKAKPYLKSSTPFVICIALSLFLHEVPAKAGEAVLFAAGDTMIARWAHEEEFDGYAEKMFGGVFSQIQIADAALVNLECVVSLRGNIVYKGETNPYPYRARPTMLKFLKKAGINIVSQSNNHVGDYGQEALLDSLDYLNKAGILPLGAGKNMEEAQKIRYVKIRDIMVAFIAFDTQENTFQAAESKPGTFFVQEAMIPEIIEPMVKQARKAADVVILTPHWGVNWAIKPTAERQKIARALIDAGADAILGHSSHILQGMEVYKGRPILYDMGSFLFDSVADDRVRRSMFFELSMVKEGITKVRAYPISLSWRSVDLAKGKDREAIFSQFINRSESLNENFTYEKTDNYLIIQTVYNNKGFFDNFFKKKYEPNPLTLNKENKIDIGHLDTKPECVYNNEKIRFTQEPKVFENGIKLLLSRIPSQIPSQTAFFVECYFGADQAVPKPPCQIELSLYSTKSGRQVASSTHGPGDWSYPTVKWEPGEVIRDKHLFRVPMELRDPAYELYLNVISGSKIGLKQGERVKLIGETDEKGALLGTIKIVKKKDNYVIPGLYSYEKNAAYSK